MRPSNQVERARGRDMVEVFGHPLRRIGEAGASQRREVEIAEAAGVDQLRHGDGDAVRLHHPAAGEGVRFEQVGEAVDRTGDAAAVGGDVVQTRPAADVTAALEHRAAVRETRPDVLLEERVPAIREVVPRRLVRNGEAGEELPTLGMEIHVARI
jgi:hypothetical protein